MNQTLSDHEPTRPTIPNVCDQIMVCDLELADVSKDGLLDEPAFEST